MADYTITYRIGSARADGVELDVAITRDDGAPILGSLGTRRVYPIAPELLAACEDEAALDELIRKEVEAWGVPVADEEARKVLAEAQAAADKAKALVREARTIALDAKDAQTEETEL